MLLALTKAWLWLKHYWYLPLAVVVAIVLFFVSRKAYESLANLLINANARHQKELDDLTAAHNKAIKERDDAIKQYQKVIETIEKQYADAQKELDAKKRKEIQKIVEQTKNDPDALAKRLSDATGFTVILPEE